MRRNLELTSEENSINILNAMAAEYAIVNPDDDVPEELQPNEALVDNRVKFFVPSARNDFDFSSVPKGTQIVVIEHFSNDTTWKDLVALKNCEAKNCIEMLYLQHDGIIDGETSDIVETIAALPNLREIHYCGYYAQYSKELIEVAPPHINLIQIF
jgi:hypothetical protein